MSEIQKLLKGMGIDKLQVKQTELKTMEEVITENISVLGIYFSAHWCPPCRKFTPVLKDFYNKLKSSNKADHFEIVFASSDKDQAAFDDYFKEMPWCAIPFEYRDAKENLSTKYGIRGIPTLIVLNAETKRVTDGRGWVMENNDKTDDPDKVFGNLVFSE